MTAQRRILVVSPVFHGYWQAIAAALRARGHAVAVHCYDASANPVQSVGNKMLHELPESLRWQPAERAMTDRAIRAFQHSNPDAVLVVKGDQLGAAWWEAVDASRTPTVLWLYDELRRMRYSMADLAQIGAVASYSPLDVQAMRNTGIHAQFVPLGHDSLTEFTAQPTGDLSFVGARYPNRERLLRRLAGAGIPVIAYGRTWSRHPWDVLRTRQFAGPGIRTGRDLGRARAYGAMAGSAATLNMHGDQDGFTMRTFEAPGVGAVQLIDRADVSAFYEPGNEVLVFSDADELVDLARRVLRDRVWAKQVRAAGRARTLAEHTLVHRVSALEQMWD